MLKKYSCLKAKSECFVTERPRISVYKTFSSKLVLKVLDGKKASQEVEDKEKENYLKV